MSAVWRMSDFKNIFITILCQNYLRGRSPWLPAAPLGIGNAIVRKFVEEGAKVVLCGLLTFSDNCRPKLPEEMINVVEMDGNCYFCGQMI